MTVYCAFIRGQGGQITSPGMDQMAAKARALGIQADVFNYQDIASVNAAIARHRVQGHKIAVVGYSLGAGTVEAISAQHIHLDLLMALDPSMLGYNYKLDPKTTKLSILWHDSDWLLSGPLGHAGLDLGFNIVHETLDPHLFIDIDPTIQANVLGNLVNLKGT
jgi:hypothetical protein